MNCLLISKFSAATVVLFIVLPGLFKCDRSAPAGLSPAPPNAGKVALPPTTSGSKDILVDTALYNRKLLYLAHDKPSAKWPAKAALPLNGAILPFKRIVAYYGNYYSKGMGILGELEPPRMLEKLMQEVRHWEAADSQTPVQPALEYIAVTAQRTPGPGGKYRLRMPFHQVDKTLDLARKINAIVFLDIQVGHSTLMEELPPLLPYLKLPTVHLAIDPEYSMKGGEVPGSKIGTFSAADINYASAFLARVVQEYKLPPKVLVVHRFTKQMVQDYRQIITRPEVQFVMNMDGFGFPAKKKDTYRSWIASEPVQFTGFKIFYKNDILTDKGRTIMSPGEVMKLYPSPIYIHYQ
jgi:hypothetical protein